MLAVDRQDDHALEHEAERAGHRHRQQRAGASTPRLSQQRVRLHQAAQRQQHQRRDIGADRDEGAVAEIQHVHQAEHQRQARTP